MDGGGPTHAVPELQTELRPTIELLETAACAAIRFAALIVSGHPLGLNGTNGL